MNYQEIEAIVRSRCKPKTWPEEPPALSDWQSVEAHFDYVFPAELYELHKLESQYWIDGEYLDASQITTAFDFESQHNENWSQDYIPFHAIGNGDYLCFRRSEGQQSAIYYVAHDEPGIERIHASLADYIRDEGWFP